MNNLEKHNEEKQRKAEEERLKVQAGLEQVLIELRNGKEVDRNREVSKQVR